jgi:hypothetical protein
MTHSDYLVFAPAVVALIVMAALLHEYRWPRARTPADKRAMGLLLSWLTPGQEKQWQARGDFEVIGCDTGRRYRITYRAVMNVHQLDPDGHSVQQWCFAPEGRLAVGDVLLAQKIALETMETKAVAIANVRTFRDLGAPTPRLMGSQIASPPGDDRAKGSRETSFRAKGSWSVPRSVHG